MGIDDCVALYKSAKINEAIKCFDTLLRYQEESHEVNYCLGVVLFEAGDFKRASDHFKKANAIEEDYLCIYYTGLCYFNMLDFESSEYFFRKAIEKKPLSAEAYFMLALSKLYQSDIEAFNKSLKRAVLIDKIRTRKIAERFINSLSANPNRKRLVNQLKMLMKDVFN